MKRKSYIIFGLVLALALTAGFGVGRVYAGGGGSTTGCFTDTNGNYAETAICWLYNNAITSGTTPTTYSPNNNVTRAQMAIFLQKIATFGETRISVGPTAWQPNGTNPSASLYYWGAYTALKPNQAVSSDYVYQASLPMVTALHSQQTTIKGVELCYDATHGGYLSMVNVDVANTTNFMLDTILLDSTDQTDAACRTYTFASPLLVNTTTTLTVVLTIHTSAVGDQVNIWSVSAIEGGTTLPAGVGPAPFAPSLDPDSIPDTAGEMP